MVLLARAAADADGAYNFAVALQRDTAREDHNLAVVRGMDAEKLSARLRVRRQVFGRDVEGARGVGLLLRNIDAADPGAVHADVGHEVAALIGHRDVHGLPHFSSLLLGRRKHAAPVSQFPCRHMSSSKMSSATRWERGGLRQ